jgi:hypothetical protein
VEYPKRCVRGLGRKGKGKKLTRIEHKENKGREEKGE